MFVVYDNNKEASKVGFPELIGKCKGWKTAKFTTLPEAQKYAAHWLGEVGQGMVLRLGQKFDYDGYGDIIEIREVK